jgi:exonuclease SbcD
MIAAARQEIGAGPLVVTGHLHVAGAIESEGAERRILIGGEHAVPVDLFPEDVAYVALGHLHRPQAAGRENVRYAGSLFPLSKTEIDYLHGVTVVTIAADGEPHEVKVEHVSLARPVPHLRLPSQGALAPGDIEAAFAALGLDPATAIEKRPFVHLTVRTDGPAVGLKAEIDAIAEKHPIRLVSLAIDRPRAEGGDAPEAPALRLAEREPVELFKEAFAREHGVEPTPEQLRLFHSVELEE